MGMFDSIYVKGVKYQGLFGHDELQTKDLGLKLAIIVLVGGKPVVSWPGVDGGLAAEDLELLENGEIWACQYFSKYRPWGDFNYYDLVDWKLTFKGGKLTRVSFDLCCKDVVTFTVDPDYWQVHPLRRIRDMCYVMNMPGSRRKFTKHVVEIMRRHGVDAAHRYMDKKGLLRVYENPNHVGHDTEFSDVVPQEEREAAMSRAFAMAWNAQTAPMRSGQRPSTRLTAKDLPDITFTVNSRDLYTESQLAVLKKWTEQVLGLSEDLETCIYPELPNIKPEE